MSRLRRRAILGALAASLAVALPTAAAQAANGDLVLAPPWGGADQTAPNRVEVSYTISGSKNVPPAALTAAQDAVNSWNTKIDSRENGWDFDLVLFGSGSGALSAGFPSFSTVAPQFSHRPNHNPPGQGGGGGGNGGGGGGEEPDITIQVKKGGGTIAGSAQRTLDANGFVVKVKIQISGGSFGLQNNPDTIQQITEHELGHALALGHHTNEDDLMGQTVGYEGGGPSACDLDGFVAAHHWLTVDLVAAPHLNHINKITCP